jgi:branched-chain amino acid aminotransferase
MKIYFNGKFVSREKAKVSVFDHGFLYGDGVFEGIRSYDCLVFRLQEHIERLYESAHAINLNIGMTQPEMIEVVVKTMKANKLRDGYIRLIVSRGEGDLGLDPRKCYGKPSIIVIADKISLYPEKLYKKGMEIVTVATLRNLPEALNPRIKSLNYLNNILAKIEAVNLGYQEALMLNHLGFIAECTGDNVFIVKKGKLSTPAVEMGALKGITRDAVLELAKNSDIPTHEGMLSRQDIYTADECFLTGTAAEIIPVVKVDGRSIGNGKPGKLTQNILAQFHKLTKVSGVKYKI